MEMRTKSDPYVLVDIEQKIVIDRIQTLPENWRNIAGLPGLTDEELCDLGWAGWSNLGWINVKSEKLKEFNSSPENLELNKNELKKCISNERKIKEVKLFQYKNLIIEPSQEFRVNLFLKCKYSENNPKEFYLIKILNRYYKFTKNELNELYDIIETCRMNLDEWEAGIYIQIESCKNLSEISEINYGV